MAGPEVLSNEAMSGMLLRDVEGLKARTEKIADDIGKVRETLAAIAAQDIGGKLQRLEDGRLAKLEADVESLKGDRIRFVAIFTTIQVVFSVIVVFVGWYLKGSSPPAPSAQTAPPPAASPITQPK